MNVDNQLPAAPKAVAYETDGAAQQLYESLRQQQHELTAGAGRLSPLVQEVLEGLVACAECLDAPRLATALCDLADLHRDRGHANNEPASYLAASVLYLRSLDLMYRMHGERYEPSYRVIQYLAGCKARLGEETTQRELYNYAANIQRVPLMAIRPDCLVQFRENDAILQRYQPVPAAQGKEHR